MNRIYRLVFNPSLGQVQVAAEFARRPRRCALQRMRCGLWLAPLAAAMLLTGSLQATAQSLPQNGNIVAGSASININGNVMTIDQTSAASLIQWSSFDIGAASKVQFNQVRGSQATAINLVTGSSGSLISGELSSIGQVFLINPAGITFTSGASVNVGGLLASTLSPGTPGLLDANGVSSAFQLAGGGTGALVSNNGGTLSAASGGISLIGGAVSNTGIISASNGNINLVAAGAAMVLNGVSSSGMSQLTFLPTSVGTFAGTGINNTGVLNARSISMNALMGPGLSSTGINAGGTIIANAIDAGDGSLTIRSSAPVALSNATITAGSVAVAGAGAGGPVAIQMTDGSIRASTVAFDGGPSGNVMLGGVVKADTISIAANNAVQTGGTLEGTLSLATQGGATLGQSGNRIGSVGGSVGSDLTLTTSTDLYNGGALSVGGSTVLEAGGGNITLTNTGNSFGNRLDANAGDITLVSSGALGLGNINARSLAAQGGSIGLNGTIITTGDQTYQSAVTLRGNSTLQGSVIQFNDTIDGSYRLAVDSSGMTTFSGAVGGSTALQALNVTTGTGTRLAGDVTTSGALAFDGPVKVIGTRSLTSANGGMRFGGPLDGDGHSLSLSARQLTLGGAVGTSGAFDRIHGRADTISLGSRIASTGAILLEGDVRLDGNTQLISAGGGAITTDGISSNTTAGYNLVMSTTGQVQINGNISAADVSITGQLFNGRGIASKGNLDIDSALTLVQMGSYQVDGRARFRSLGDITLADAGNRFSGEVSLSGRSAQLRAGNLQLGNTLLSDNLQLDLSGFLQQAAGSVVDIGGTTRIDAGGFVSLDRVDGVGRPVNLFGGAVALKGGNSSIYANGTLAFSHFDVASLWTIADVVKLPASGTSIGLQFFQGDVVLTGDSVLDSQLGQINFRGRIDGPHALSLTSGLEVVFADDVGSRQALASLGINGATPLQLGGNITTDGAIRLGNVNLASNTPRLFSIRSNNGDVVIGRIDGSSDGRSSLALTAHGTLELQSGAGTTGGAWLTDLELKGSSVTTKAIRTTGRLDVTSSSGFTQGGAFTIGGDASFSAGPSGNLVLDAYPNTFGGKIALKGAVARIQALSGLALDSVDTTTLEAYSGGAMSLANANVAAAASLNGTSLLLDGASIGGLLQATARTGDIRQGSGALTFGNNSELRAGTDIVLGNAGNRLGNALQAWGRDVTLTSSTALDLQNLQAMRDAQLSGNGVRLGTTSVLGALQVDSAGAITQSDALQVAGNSRFQAGSDITLDQSGNRFDGSVALQGDNVAITTGGGLLLDNVSTSGNLGIRAGSAGVSQQAALQADGRTDVSTQGTIVLDRADNRFTGAVGLDGNGVDLRAAGDLQVDRLNSTGQSDVRLHAGEGLHLLVNAIDTGTGNLTLLADGGALQANALLAGNNVTLTGRDGVRLGGDLRSKGSLTLASSNADIVQDAAPNGVGGSVQAGGMVQVNAGGGRIALGNGGNRFGGALNLSGGDINVVGDTLLLGNVNAGGQLSLASAGDIHQQGAVQVVGTTRLNAGGDIDLQAAGNRFGGNVTVQGRQVALTSNGTLQLQGVVADSLVARSGGRLTLDAAGIAGNAVLEGQQLHFGATHVGGNLQATGSSGIDQDGTLRVDGNTDLGSSAGITLALSGNDLRGTVSLAGTGIDLASTGDLRIGSLDNRNAAVRLQAGGALLLPGTVIDAGSGDLQLLAGGALQLPGALRGNNITVRSGQDLQIGQDMLAAGLLQLDSGGALTQNGGVLGAQRLQGHAGGKATLRGDNRIATLGDFSSQGLELRAVQGLQVNGTVQAGAQGLLDVQGGDLLLNGSVQASQLRLQSSGAIRAGAGGRLLAERLSGRADGPTLLGDASTFVANAIGTLGDFQSPAGFSLTNSGSLTLATLNGSAFSVDAGSNGFYLKVQGGGIHQLGTTPVLAGTSHWWSSDGIGTQPLPIYLISAGSNHTVDFIGRPPAYFYGVGADGLPLVVGGGLNLPTAIVGARTQGSVLPRVAYVDMGALNAQYRAFGIVQPGIRLPADQTVACDSGDPDAECAQ